MNGTDRALTPAQARYLAEIRRAGAKRYNGRARKPLEALERLGLVEVDWDADLDSNKGRLRWTLTARPAQTARRPTTPASRDVQIDTSEASDG